MRKYVVQIIIEEEDDDEFWAAIPSNGVDAITSLIEESLEITGWERLEVKVVSYTETE